MGPPLHACLRWKFLDRTLYGDKPLLKQRFLERTGHSPAASVRSPRDRSAPAKLHVGTQSTGTQCHKPRWKAKTTFLVSVDSQFWGWDLRESLRWGLGRVRSRAPPSPCSRAVPRTCYALGRALGAPAHRWTSTALSSKLLRGAADRRPSGKPTPEATKSRLSKSHFKIDLIFP